MVLVFALVPSLQQLFYQLPRRGFETQPYMPRMLGIFMLAKAVQCWTSSLNFTLR